MHKYQSNHKIPTRNQDQPKGWFSRGDLQKYLAYIFVYLFFKYVLRWAWYVNFSPMKKRTELNSTREITLS